MERKKKTRTGRRKKKGIKQKKLTEKIEGKFINANKSELVGGRGEVYHCSASLNRSRKLNDRLFDYSLIGRHWAQVDTGVVGQFKFRFKTVAMCQRPLARIPIIFA